MIAVNDMINFLMCVPKCRITDPKSGVQFVVDSKGEIIGEINWNTFDFAVYDDYEFCSEVVNQIESMTGKKVIDIADQRYTDKGIKPFEPEIKTPF